MLLHRIASWLFPSRCACCGEVSSSHLDGDLCNSCLEKLKADYISVCPKCHHRSADCTCAPDVLGRDWDRSPFTTVYPLIFDGYYTGYDKDSTVSSLVYRMKRKRTSGASLFFARIIARALSHELTLKKLSTADFTVTFIPRSSTAFKRYGFDHMETVSKHTAKMLGCKYAPLLSRKGGTDQKALSGDERIINSQTSIILPEKHKKLVQGAKLILLDDIVTTGSSMRAAVSKLSFAGADTIIPASAMISKTQKKATVQHD
ncbi:MAG: ComF family protein [Ruminococcaceae bacterium]|nr:ComF family protein [Oscillospiraceae bacterium]